VSFRLCLAVYSIRRMVRACQDRRVGNVPHLHPLVLAHAPADHDVRAPRPVVVVGRIRTAIFGPWKVDSERGILVQISRSKAQRRTNDPHNKTRTDVRDSELSYVIIN